MPSPIDGSRGEEIKPDGPFSGLVFKTLSDLFIGQISIFKVFSGKLQSNSGFYNITRGAREKIGQIFGLMGKAQIPTESVQAGDIACVSKLKETSTGDSIGDEKNPVKFEGIKFPEPAISFSLKPKTRSDEDKISNALHKLTAEDPTLKVTRDEQTQEMIASGMGDMHINIMIARMKARYGVQVDLGTPKVAYKETITSKGDSQYRHKKQTGGAGQFGEVELRVEPSAEDNYEFEWAVFGGAISNNYQTSIEKGVNEGRFA
jgi:elongation factor G